MKQALIEAGGTRIRPILMTAIATIGALVPLLFGHDSSIIFKRYGCNSNRWINFFNATHTLCSTGYIRNFIHFKNKITKKFNM